MSEIENKEKIALCKWRNPKVAWVPVVYTIVLGIAALMLFSTGARVPEINAVRIPLSLAFGTMTVSMAYLILKKGQSNTAKAFTLLSSLAITIMFIPSIRSADAIGAIIFAAFIGIPINYYWDHICKKISG